MQVMPDNRGILHTITRGRFGTPAESERLGDPTDVQGPTDPTAQIMAELSEQFLPNCKIEVCATITENEGIWTTILTAKDGTEIKEYLKSKTSLSVGDISQRAGKKTRTGKRRKRGKSRRRGKRC
jgi:hypothetical protein